MGSILLGTILPLAAGLAAWGFGLAGAVRARPSPASFALCALALWCVPVTLDRMAGAGDLSAVLDTVGGYRFGASALLAGTAALGLVARARKWHQDRRR